MKEKIRTFLFIPGFELKNMALKDHLKPTTSRKPFAFCDAIIVWCYFSRNPKLAIETVN